MKRFYRFLLSLYPAHFREEFAGSMERQFSDDYSDARGRIGRVWLCLQAIADLAMTVPHEVAREVWQDLGYAVRVYRQRLLVTALAVAALALAIGSTTGIFSVLNAFLIRSLPFQEPERLVQLWLSPTNVGIGRNAFLSWCRGSRYLDDAAGYATNDMNLRVTNESARVRVSETTVNFLHLLGTEPELGRGFSTGEDLPGRDGVAVIGYALWQQLFHGDAGALGSTIHLNGVPLTVIGIAPRGLDFPEKSEVWTPTVYDLERIPKAGALSWQTIGRLKNGVGIDRASRMFDAEVLQANAGHHVPQLGGVVNEPHLFSLRDRLAGPVRPASQVLMGIVAFVLLIACANVGQLLLSRSVERRQELAIRAALGASRSRLTQQMVTEAFALTSAAAILGLFVANWTARVADSALPAQLGARQYTVLDWRVMGFALGLAVITGLAFGVLPASLIGRANLAIHMNPTQRGSSHSSANRMRGVLIGMQAALTVALTAGAFILGGSFLKLLRTDLAFHTDRVVTLNVSLSGTRYEMEHREGRYYGEALRRLRELPAVESAAAVSNLPLMTRMFMAGRFKLESGQTLPLSMIVSASPGYFRTMDTQLIQGREFTNSDRQDTGRVAVVSDDLARAIGPGSPVGRKVNVAPWGIRNGLPSSVSFGVSTTAAPSTKVARKSFFPWINRRPGRSRS